MTLINNKGLDPLGDADTDRGVESTKKAERRHKVILKGPYSVCISCPYEHTVDKKVAQKLGFV